jgi:CheY-like chemotaxis protein
MLPPVVYLNQHITGTVYTMPVYIHDKVVNVLISVDETMEPGATPHTVELKKSDSTVSSDSSKGRVMIVDDSSLIRKMLRGLLENNGYTVAAEAVNGAEAVEMYDNVKPDVVTLDITMPVMDGVEALKQIKAKDAKANVIMITAAGQQDKVVEALKSGANLFIMKPFNEEDVIKNFENVLK